MKHILLCFVFSLTLPLFSQQKTVRVIEAEGKVPVPYVYIDFLNGNGKLTNSKGNTSLPVSVKEIEIVHLGFKTVRLKTIDIADVIVLEPESLNINDVVINGHKRKSKRIFPKRSLNSLMPHNVGTGNTINPDESIGIYIPKEDTVASVIAKIILYPTDYNTLNLATGATETQKNAKYSPFKINLYTVHPEIGIPLKPIFEQDITAQLLPGEKELTITIPLDNPIDFPKEGIFIVVSSFDKEYYEQVGSVVKTSPSFYRIGTGSKSKFKMFIKKPRQDFWERNEWYWKNNSVYYAGIEVVQ